jgi:hypothetical protein
MSDDRKPSPREKVLFDKLQPPSGRHRAQPKSGGEQVFEATQARNERRTLPEKYTRKYRGRHRKEN